MVSENYIESDDKQVIDHILQYISYGDIFMQYTPPEKDIEIEQKTPESFKYFLLPKRKQKKSSLFSSSKTTSNRYKKIRQKKKDGLKFIKQGPLHPRDRLARKVKNIIGDNDIKFIKLVSFHLRDRLNVDDDVNIDDLSDTSTVNYTNNTTVETPRK